MSLYSALYDDVYFSRAGGLAETKHVFLNGCALPRSWIGKKRFCIAETGFGTGLNLLAAAKLFSETANNQQYLDLLSVELHPLPAVQIRTALEEWRQDLHPFVDKLVDNYPLLTPGFHRMWLAPNICLTLLFGDAAQSYAQVCSTVDCWFLDGFSPVKNPAMWSQALFTQIARLSHADTTLASFTVARHVCDGLEQAGFTLTKTKGFAHKRHCLTGRFTKHSPPVYKAVPKAVDIYGAGIAGTSVARVLAPHGISCRLIDPTGRVASGASGNLMGMASLRVLSPATPQASFYHTAYDYARRFYLSTQNSTVLPTAGLHLPHGKKTDTLRAHLAAMNWPDTHMTQIDAHQASALAGIPINTQAIVLHDSLAVSPQEFCREFAQFATGLYTDLTPNEPAAAFRVIATGAGTHSLKTIRGQTDWLQSPLPLKAALQFGGYALPQHPQTGLTVLGATYDRNFMGTDQSPDDSALLREQARPFLPDAVLNAPVQYSWVGFRAQSADKFPLIGFQDSSTFLSTAHGSHGLTSAPLAAEILLSQLLGLTLPIGAKTMESLNPNRFIKDT